MDVSAPPRDIAVEFVLAGGVRYTTELPSDSKLLHDLHVALLLNQRPDLGTQPFVLQVPLDGGTRACTFMSTALAALTTSPPVLVEPTAYLAPATAPAPAQAARPRYLEIEDFLTPAENKKLLAYALEQEPNFTGSSVIDGQKDRRKSRVLFGIKDSPWRATFLDRLALYLPHIIHVLGKADFRAAKSEVQLTASNDGDFFRPHADSVASDARVAGREVTFVYYMHRTPRPYAGGGLFLYSGMPGQPDYERGAGVTVVEPRNNLLVAFSSDTLHEVDMVRCPSAAFADSRFTVNGWFWRESPEAA